MAMRCAATFRMEAALPAPIQSAGWGFWKVEPHVPATSLSTRDGRSQCNAPRADQGAELAYAESFEHSREAFPPDSLVTREGVARVIETMRAFDAVPAGMKMEPESVFDDKFVLKALGR